ncbi:MAG: hypothetical protein IJR54_01280 [Oscillibacter sp.]|nr:hypothetical protein [Oscillibacter sp.]
MKLLSRDFTVWEKLVLLALVLALMGMGYYQFIDQPVRHGIEEAHAERDKLQLDLNAINLRIKDYKDREKELNEAKELRQEMPSYNSSEEELQILNGILNASNEYAFSFDKITLNGNQIRRNFQLSFTAPSFEAAKGIFTRLSGSRIRCLIGNIECSGVNEADGNVVNVKANGTFYETKVDSVLDAVLAELTRGQNASEAAAQAAS